MRLYTHCAHAKTTEIPVNIEIGREGVGNMKKTSSEILTSFLRQIVSF
jgi:hypothetical protein